MIQNALERTVAEPTRVMAMMAADYSAAAVVDLTAPTAAEAAYKNAPESIQHSSLAIHDRNAQFAELRRYSVQAAE